MRRGLVVLLWAIIGVLPRPSRAAEPAEPTPDDPASDQPPATGAAPGEKPRSAQATTLPSDPEAVRRDLPAPVDPQDKLEGPRSVSVQKDVIPDPRGLSIGLRLGWGVPQGDVQHGLRLGDNVVGIAPVWFDLGYRVTQRLLLGVYAHYAFAIARDCPTSQSCNASDVRFGLQAQWHFGDRQSIDHYVGLGAGFEIYEREVGSTSYRSTGFEFANLQLGEDLSLGRRFALGPFLSLSLGKFTAVEELSGTTPVSDTEIARKAWHSWMVLGVRLSFGA